jgi:hypothetical protein
MIEYANDRRGASFGAAVRGLKRHKRSDAYKLQLLQRIKDEESLVRAATTSMAKKKVRLTVIEARAELACLNAGETPCAYSGLIHFPRPDLDFDI